MSKSDRHTELQNMVVRWIQNRSFKMCGLPEANVVGYIADYVAIAGMFDKYHTHYVRHSRLTKKHGYYRGSKGAYVEYGDIDRWYVCVFEVKVSRNDFLNTFSGKESPHAEARMQPAGTAHWVVAEKGICKPEELPDFWGLLTPYGTGLTELKIPKLHILQTSHLHAIAFDMLWLQMNFRRSYHEQCIAMAEAIKHVQKAMIENKPTGELLHLCNLAVETCRGFVHYE